MLLLFVVLLLLWGAGMLTAFTMGGLLHILLVVALIAIVVHFVSGNRRMV